MPCIITTSIFLVCRLLFIAPQTIATELQLGKAREGALHNGAGGAYTLTLEAGDYVQVAVDLRETELIVAVYDPSGNKFRVFRLDPEYGNQFRFVAESAGTYRLEVSGSGRSKEGSYSIILAKLVSLEDRLAPAPSEPYESSLIEKLEADLNAGKADAVASFWKAAEAKTTPLLDPIPGDDKYMLATFVWRGDETTRTVIVQWFPYVRAWLDDYRMIHLPGTNVWYKTLRISRQARFVYRLAPNASYIRVSRDRDPAAIAMFMASGQTDPLNPKHWLHDAKNPDADKYQDWSAVQMPGAPAEIWAERRPGVPRGTIERHRFKSELLKDERELGLYLPAGYNGSAAQPYGLVVLFDEGAYIPTEAEPPLIPAPDTLDNLISAERIRPVVMLLVGNPPGRRNVELGCNLKFLESLKTEMIPWLRRHYRVTSDPKNTVIGGLSLGGLSAACAALHYPETFGNVLSQSGGFAQTPSGSDGPAGFNPEVEPNWAARQFIQSPRLPLRFYITVGKGEFDPAGFGWDGLVANRHFRDVLLAKGYEVTYQEYYGGHDFLSWRGSLADGLIALIGADRK